MWYRKVMDESRIFIIGSAGQLGRALTLKYPKAIAVDRDTFDMTNRATVEMYDWSKVDTIINAAAYANVDGAQTPEGRAAAWSVNASAVAHLSKIAIQHKLMLVHISTDYVFDGTKSPHTEEENFTPLGVYAQTKAAGDIAVGIAPLHFIIRASWVIGDGPNFVRTMTGLAAKNISPSVVNDQIGRLTFTSTLVEGIHHLLTSKADCGTYNLSDDGEPASWADVTRAVFKELGRDDLTVTDTTTEAYFADKPQSSPRPLQSTLDLSKIKATGFVIPEWRKSLAEYIKAEQAKPKE